MKKVSGALLFILFSGSGCSYAPVAAVSVQAESTTDAGDLTANKKSRSGLAPTDADVMYHVFSAEVLGADGDFSGAASAYLEAALLSDDPGIAQRAARVAVSANDWQMVELASDRWALLDPGNLAALQLAAGSRLKEGDYVGAAYQLGKILEATMHAQAHGWQMVTRLLAPAADQAKAAKVLDKLLRDFDAGANVDALLARSQLAARTGQFDQAEKLADEAVSLAPGRADLLAWSGRLAVNHKDEQKALERYRQAWEVSPRDIDIGMAYAELLKRNDDLNTGQKVLAGLPDTPDMRFSRIAFALRGNDRKSAVSLYRGFAGADYGDSQDAAFQAAQSAELLELPREAIEWYKKVKGEHAMQAVMRRAFLLADIGEVEAARNLLARIRIETDVAVQSQSYQAEAQILKKADRKVEAMQLLTQALTDLPGEMPLRYDRALLAVDLDKLDLAESDLRQIISVQPKNAAALNALGYTLADLTDRFAEAEQLIRQAYELRPRDASIIDSMGWIAYRVGRLQEAENYLRAAWQASKNAEIAAHLGEVLWARGQHDSALQSWRSGLQLESDNELLISTMHRFGVAP